MTKTILKIIACAGALITTLAFSAQTDHSDTQKLVAHLSKNQLSIAKSFKTKFPDLTGYVLQDKKGNPKAIAYGSDHQKYLIVGNVIDHSGQNLTETYTNQYIKQPMAAKTGKLLHTLNWFSQGSDKAPAKMYVFIDPNCSYCHLLYKEFLPLINDNKLQVRWIPVGILKQDSIGKSAKLLSTDAKTSVKLLHEDEQKFSMQNEEGGIKPLDVNSSNLLVTSAFKKAKENTQAFADSGLGGTPTMFFKNKKGQWQVWPSYATPAQMKKDILPIISNKW